MKKSVFLAIAAACTLCASAANGVGQQGGLKQQKIDSLSYAIGMSQSQGLKEYLVSQMHLDTAYMDEFVKGLGEAVKSAADKKKSAYFAGVQIGQQVAGQMIPGLNTELFGKESERTVNVDRFLEGFLAATLNPGSCEMSLNDAQQYAEATFQSVKKEAMMEAYGQNKAEGEKFLAANKKAKGVVTLPSGLQYKILKKGNGEIPADTSKVKVHYEGRLIDGTVFDSSYKRGEPTSFRANQVIKGWTEALTKMPVGSTWEVYIPQELAYGEREAGKDIKPFSMLIFKIELIEIEK